MLDNLEKMAKIISLIAIPIALWWLGSEYQTADGRSKRAVEYVKLSIQIITNDNEADPLLLDWATKTLNHHSYVKFDAKLKKAVSTGEPNLSPSTSSAGWFAVVGGLETKEEALKYVEPAWLEKMVGSQMLLLKETKAGYVKKF